MPGKIKLCWLHIALFLGYNGGSIGTKCVPWDKLDILVRSNAYMYDSRSLPHFYLLEPCNQKNSWIGGILADFWALIEAS